jgi:hypothetical protein
MNGPLEVPMLKVTPIAPPPVARNNALRDQIERYVVPRLHSLGIAADPESRGLRIDLDDPDVEASRFRSVLRSCAIKAGYSIKTKVVRDDPEGNPVAIELWVTDWSDPEAAKEVEA